MSRAALTPTNVTRTGEDIATLSAANADGYAVSNDGATWFEAANSDAGTVTITVQTPRTIDGLAVAEYTITVAQNERQIFGPFPRDTFNQSSGADKGKVYVDFSAVTGLTFGAYRLS